MTQVEYQASQAEERSQETRSFVRQVRAATRRKYTPEEKIRMVLEGFRRETTVNDLCRREGIKPHSYYAWTKEFMEAGKERLTRDSVRDATRQEIEQLKRENSELKQLVGELSREMPTWRSRQLAAWLTDHRGLSVSASTVYRILRREGLVKRIEYQLAAGKEYQHKTTGSHQLWATDALLLPCSGMGLLLPRDGDG